MKATDTQGFTAGGRNPDHGHSHGSADAPDSPTAGTHRIVAALVLIGGYMIAEVIAGFLVGSLALLAHAGHMLTDAVFLVLALATMRHSGRSTAEHTYGFHRTEVLAALVNALTLWGISVWVLIEAYRRFSMVPEVDGQILLVVSSIGLVVNIAALWTVHGAAQKNTSLEGTFQHMITDLLGSVAVVVAGVLVWAFGWHVADPVVGVLIGVLVLMSTWRLLSRVVDVLLEGTPEHVDLYALCHKLEAIDGVTVIHDVHCWTLAPGYVALTAHMLVEPGYEANGGHESLLDRVRDIAYDEFNVQHITVQLETSAGRCLERHHVDHLLATARAPT
ncbi:MAG: cation diffusion facilitator family transporter [Gemmatimonadetes bacterium]|nr:cation diffusion facilitator family transporter [Gemmatimonadota bacterium]